MVVGPRRGYYISMRETRRNWIIGLVVGMLMAFPLALSVAGEAAPAEEVAEFNVPGQPYDITKEPKLSKWELDFILSAPLLQGRYAVQRRAGRAGYGRAAGRA